MSSPWLHVNGLDSAEGPRARTLRKYAKRWHDAGSALVRQQPVSGTPDAWFVHENAVAALLAGQDAPDAAQAADDKPIRDALAREVAARQADADRFAVERMELLQRNADLEDQLVRMTAKAARLARLAKSQASVAEEAMTEIEDLLAPEATPLKR
jgi:hypothetical protein